MSTPIWLTIFFYRQQQNLFLQRTHNKRNIKTTERERMIIVETCVAGKLLNTHNTLCLHLVNCIDNSEWWTEWSWACINIEIRFRKLFKHYIVCIYDINLYRTRSVFKLYVLSIFHLATGSKLQVSKRYKSK